MKTPGFDIDDAHECVSKARAIVEVVSRAITAERVTEEAALYSDSLWAARDSLDRLGRMLGLDLGGTKQ